MQGALICSRSMPGVDMLKVRTHNTQWVPTSHARTVLAASAVVGSPVWHWPDGSCGTTLAKFRPAWSVCAHRESNPGHKRERLV